jgi:hypothetical protein
MALVTAMVPMIGHIASKTDPIFMTTTCPADTPRFLGIVLSSLSTWITGAKLFGGIAGHPYCPQAQVAEVDECWAKCASARSSHSGRALGVVRAAGVLTRGHSSTYSSTTSEAAAGESATTTLSCRVVRSSAGRSGMVSPAAARILRSPG